MSRSASRWGEKIVRIALGADHAGYELKDLLSTILRDAGHEVIDCGTNSSAAVDYPDYAERVVSVIDSAAADRGIIVCGSGVGACVAANKMRGIRACVCHDVYSAHQGVEHDQMNVLCLGARIIGPALAEEVVLAFVDARFSGEERHRRRLAKVAELEARGEPRHLDQIPGG